MDASPGQFAAHLPDRAQLRTRDKPRVERMVPVRAGQLLRRRGLRLDPHRCPGRAVTWCARKAGLRIHGTDVRPARGGVRRPWKRDALMLAAPAGAVCGAGLCPGQGGTATITSKSGKALYSHPVSVCAGRRFHRACRRRVGQDLPPRAAREDPPAPARRARSTDPADLPAGQDRLRDARPAPG